MTRFNDKLSALFSKPQHVGSLAEDHPQVGVANVGLPASGDVVKLSIRVNRDKVIDEVRYQCHGGVAVIAICEYVATWLEGRCLDEAEKLPIDDVMYALELPAIKQHCVMLVKDAVDLALQDYRNKQSRS